MTPDVVEQAKRLYADGNSLATIGGRLRRQRHDGLHKAPKKAGVKMRDTHG